MEISRPMLALLVYGLNALVDAGKKETREKIYELVETKKLIKYLNDTYQGKYWDFTSHLKYEEDVCEKIYNYENMLVEESYRKFGIENNGLLILSSIVTAVLLDS